MPDFAEFALERIQLEQWDDFEMNIVEPGHLGPGAIEWRHKLIERVTLTYIGGTEKIEGVDP